MVFDLGCDDELPVATVQRTEGGICTPSGATQCRVRTGAGEQRAPVIPGTAGAYRPDPLGAETKIGYGE